jgi:hypothetical protein
MKHHYFFILALLLVCSCHSNPVSNYTDSLVYDTKQEVRENNGEPREHGLIEELPGILSCNSDVDINNAVTFDRYVQPRGLMGLGFYYIYVLYNEDEDVVGAYRLFMD